MTVNVDLLDRTLAQIEAHPETWEQRSYRCESGMCFAGWAALLAGGRWAEPENSWNGCLVAEDDDLPEHTHGCDYGGPGVHAHERAQRVLGLHEAIADELFCAGNDIDDIRRIVADIKSSTAGAPTPPVPVPAVEPSVEDGTPTPSTDPAGEGPGSAASPSPAGPLSTAGGEPPVSPAVGSAGLHPRADHRLSGEQDR